MRQPQQQEHSPRVCFSSFSSSSPSSSSVPVRRPSAARESLSPVVATTGASSSIGTRRDLCHYYFTPAKRRKGGGSAFLRYTNYHIYPQYPQYHLAPTAKTCWSTVGVMLLWMLVVLLYVNEEEYLYDYDSYYFVHDKNTSSKSRRTTTNKSPKRLRRRHSPEDDTSTNTNLAQQLQQQHRGLPIFPYIKALQKHSNHLTSPRRRLVEEGGGGKEQDSGHAATTKTKIARRWCAVHHETNQSCSLMACGGNTNPKNTHVDLSSSSVVSGGGGYWIDHGSSTSTSGSVTAAAQQYQQDPMEERLRRQAPQTTATNGCVVSHKYQFVYIHVLKSGGMTIKSFLKNALCEGDTRMPCRTTHTNDDAEGVRFSGTDVLQVVDCNVAFRDPSVARDYLVWSVVRNPFARLYSGYAMALEFAKQDQEQKEPEHDMQQQQEEEQQENDQEKSSSLFSFTDFVLHPELRSSYSRTDPVHYQPQHEFLFSSTGCPVVDYVLRMETLREDFERLLSLIRSEEMDRYYREHGLAHAPDTDFGRRRILDHQRGQTLQEAYFHTTTTSTTDDTDTAATTASAKMILRDQVALEYARDFEIFGYDKLHIP